MYFHSFSLFFSFLTSAYSVFRFPVLSHPGRKAFVFLDPPPPLPYDCETFSVISSVFETGGPSVPLERIKPY